ncbi:M35 family metallo-endopeptidase [Dokdonella sp.]|uniref:M35 family metallo-endopeptidase n=1 Tax=Dokdonella sp. TaxID=2291710 RepID=UPI003C47A8A1
MHKLIAGLALFAVGMLGVESASAAGLEIVLSPSDRDRGDGTIEFSLVNQSSATVSVLRWQTPLDGVTNDLFMVSQNGKPAVYTGPLYKRMAPRAGDFIELKPGESLNASVELSMYYDMRAGGQYQVSYDRMASEVIREVMVAQRGGVSAGLESFDMSRATTAVYADSTPEALDMDAGDDRASVIPLAATNSFVSCSNTRQSQLATARNSSITYASNSKSYLTAGTTGSRYTWWFGSYNSSRYATVRTHFNNIYSALSSQPYTFNCSCTDSGTYAYVYPTQPYKVYLCGAFWSAPNTGTDSRAGTLVHETSHFSVVAGTGDNAYGQTAAHNLAVSNPTKAVANADNHEYFAENTPARN